MTDEEIKKMAREYAKSNIPHGIDEEYARSIIYTDGEMFERFLGWLSKTHCIVEKSKVQDEYAEASNTYWQKYSEESQMDSRHDVYERGYNVGIMNVMEDIFGKDTFKEEKI